MTAKEIFEKDGVYFGSAEIGGVMCDIGYRKRFNVWWFLTQLNTFIIVGRTDQEITKEKIDQFSAEAMKFALKNNKGLPRGFQSGVFSCAILMGEKVMPDAQAFCEVPSRKHWSAFELPLIFDTRQKKLIRYLKTPVWGRIYFSYIAGLLDDLAKKLS